MVIVRQSAKEIVKRKSDTIYIASDTVQIKDTIFINEAGDNFINGKKFDNINDKIRYAKAHPEYVTNEEGDFQKFKLAVLNLNND